MAKRRNIKTYIHVESTGKTPKNQMNPKKRGPSKKARRKGKAN